MFIIFSGVDHDIVDFCESKPCKNGGTCTNGTNLFTCACTPGWSGTLCEISELTRNKSRNSYYSLLKERILVHSFFRCVCQECISLRGYVRLSVCLSVPYAAMPLQKSCFSAVFGHDEILYSNQMINKHVSPHVKGHTEIQSGRILARSDLLF